LNSVRATNVYEERSLGIFPDTKHDPEVEELSQNGDLNSRAKYVLFCFHLLGLFLQLSHRIWGNHLGAHMRQQLSFGMYYFSRMIAIFIFRCPDMWWLATALFLVCIVEQKSLDDEANASWFNIFTIRGLHFSIEQLVLTFPLKSLS